jgi:hypothetical protein
VKELPIKSSRDGFVEDLYFLEARLETDDRLGDLKTEVTDALSAEEQLLKELRLAIRNLMKAQAKVIASDMAGDTFGQSYALGLLDVTGRNRDSILFKKYFKVNPSTVFRMPYEKEIAWFDASLAMLETETNEQLTKYKARMLEVRTNLQAALDNRKNMRIAMTVVKAKIVDWKESVNRTRTFIYGNLLPLAPSNAKTKAWADSFFKPASVASEAGESEPNEEESASEETAKP